MRLFTVAIQRALCGAMLCLLAFPGWALNLPAGVTEVTSVEGITEYRLASNGLRVLPPAGAHALQGNAHHAQRTR